MNRLRTLATILLAISVAVSCSDDGGAIFTGDEPSANDVLDDMPEINDEPADQPSEPDDLPNDQPNDEPSEPNDEPDDQLSDQPSEPDDEPDDQLATNQSAPAPTRSPTSPSTSTRETGRRAPTDLPASGTPLPSPATPHSLPTMHASPWPNLRCATGSSPTTISDGGAPSSTVVPRLHASQEPSMTNPSTPRSTARTVVASPIGAFFWPHCFHPQPDFSGGPADPLRLPGSTIQHRSEIA